MSGLYTGLGEGLEKFNKNELEREKKKQEKITANNKAIAKKQADEVDWASKTEKSFEEINEKITKLKQSDSKLTQGEREAEYNRLQQQKRDTVTRVGSEAAKLGYSIPESLTTADYSNYKNIDGKWTNDDELASVKADPNLMFKEGKVLQRTKTAIYGSDGKTVVTQEEWQDTGVEYQNVEDVFATKEGETKPTAYTTRVIGELPKGIQDKILAENPNLSQKDSLSNSAIASYEKQQKGASVTDLRAAHSEHNTNNPNNKLTLAEFKTQVWTPKKAKYAVYTTPTGVQYRMNKETGEMTTLEGATISSKTPTVATTDGSIAYADTDGNALVDDNGNILYKTISKKSQDITEAGAIKESLFAQLDLMGEAIKENPNAVGSIGENFTDFVGNVANDVLKIDTVDRETRERLDQFSGAIAAQLREMSGEAGVMTEPDFERYVSMMPNKNDSPKAYANKLKRLKSDLKAKYGNQIKAFYGEKAKRISGEESKDSRLDSIRDRINKKRGQ